MTTRRAHAIDLPYPPPYMTADVLARHLCISVDTVEAWTEAGLLPAPVKPKGVRLWCWKGVCDRLDGKAEVAVESPNDPFVMGAQREAAERKRHGRLA